MRRTVVTVLCAAAVSLSVACQRQSPAPAGQSAQVAGPQSGNSPAIAVDPADVAFGYTNGTGSKLLALRQLEDNQPIEIARAKAMVTAVCSESREIGLRYAAFQKRTEKDNGRQSDGNFANDEGHLFDIVRGQAEPDDTCLLVPAGYLQAFPIAPNELPKAERDKRAPFLGVTESAKPSVSRIEKDKGRAAQVYWSLHRGTSHEVAAVEFDAMGDSLLGSLVLVEPAGLSFFDMPASREKGRKDGGCWRVDDDCRFNSEEMDVPAIFGAPAQRLVFFTSRGAEGQAIVLLTSSDGKLVELRRAYRYQSPL